MKSTKTAYFTRSQQNRVLFGVAGGLARTLGVDSVFVRLAFIVLTLDFGLGIFLYIGLNILSDANTNATPVQRPVTNRHNVGFLLILLGVLFALRSLGLWIGDHVMWPATIVAFGSTVILLRNDSDQQRWETTPFTSVLGPRPSRLRLAAGTLVVAIGVAAFLAANHASTSGGRTFVAVLATAAGMALIFGPWLTRLGRQLMDERRQRIRTQERAEMGAHLHDSVLQTLAMIQRAETPEQMASLARQQERDLRAWLHGKNNDAEATLTSALEAIAARIDSDFQVRVNTVVVGDRAVTDELRTLLSATQEAVANAAEHSGGKTVHVYLEIADSHATARIRDEGHGFDEANVAADRQGIRESIRGRMQRHGGSATINSGPDGTEVELTLPITRPDW